MGGWLSGRPCQPIPDTIVPGRLVISESNEGGLRRAVSPLRLRPIALVPEAGDPFRVGEAAQGKA